MRNDPTQTKACASLIIAIATMLASASCSPKAPVYTDASPQKLERVCQAVDEATGLKMTETDRAWCKGLMQDWYSESWHTRPDPADQFTSVSQLRYLQAKARECRRPADAYKLTGADRWESIMRCLVIVGKR